VIAIGVTMLVVPLIVGIVGRGAESLALYAFVFSKWGVAALIVFAILGFVLGGKRTANLLAVIWGTHPVWSELGGWLEEHQPLQQSFGSASSLQSWGSFGTASASGGMRRIRCNT
jgi:hypothetical protein